MNRKAGRTQDCSPREAMTRLRQAELFLEVAELALSEEPGEHATVAVGNAVLAAIAAADAICCASAGVRYRGQDHRRAADYLAEVTGNRALAGLLRDVVDLKDASHYGLTNLAGRQARSALRKAEQIVAAARDQVRSTTQTNAEARLAIHGTGAGRGTMLGNSRSARGRAVSS
jgi:hypothetical protein